MLNRVFNIHSPRTLLVWSLAAVASLAVLGQSLLGWLQPPQHVLVDFYQEWSSGRCWRQGLDVYLPLEQTFEPCLGLSDVDSDLLVDVNVHPPPSILLTLPLAWLDYPDAVLVWNLLSLATLVPVLAIVFRELGVPGAGLAGVPALTLLLWSEPFRQQVVFAQFNLVMLLLLTGAWACERRGRSFAAGGLIGLAAAIKLIPGFLFVYFLCRRNWRALGGGVVVAAALAAWTGAVLGWDVYSRYIEDVLPRADRWLGAWTNASLPAWWTKVFAATGFHGPQHSVWPAEWLARTGIAVSMLAVTGAVAWCATRSASRAALDQAYVLAVTAMLLVSPVTWEHYFVQLILPLLVVWNSARGRPTLRLLLVLWALLLSLSFIRLTGLRRALPEAVDVLTVVSLHCYALLGLFLTQLNVLHVSARNNTPPRQPDGSRGGDADLQPNAGGVPGTPPERFGQVH